MVPDQIDLKRVVMPVVLVMNLPELTWAQREACADAIQISLKQYGELMSDLSEDDIKNLKPTKAQRR